MNSYDELLDRIDLVKLAEDYGAIMTRRGHEWRGNCPIHGGDNPTGFAVYESGGRQKWVCYTRDCGHGDAIDLVCKIMGVEPKRAFEILGGKSDVDPETKARLALERSQRAQIALEESIKIANEALRQLREADTALLYHLNLEHDAKLRRLWRMRGIPDEYQDYWDLGYRASYSISTPEGWYETPTLTIPIYEKNKELVNIRHRLLIPYSPTDKYRPERAGLIASPYICDFFTGFDADTLLIVEGEIKAMVTYITLDDANLQVVGIPGKTQTRHVVEKAKGHKTYWLLDPDAEAQAIEAARACGGRVIRTSMKIDDAILAGGIDKRGLRQLMNGARKP